MCLAILLSQLLSILITYSNSVLLNHILDNWSVVKQDFKGHMAIALIDKIKTHCTFNQIDDTDLLNSKQQASKSLNVSVALPIFTL